MAAAIVEPREARRAFAAGHERREDDFLTDANVGDICADFCDFAGDVASGNVRQRNRHIGQAAAHPEIKMIQRASFDPNEDIIRAQRWLRRVFEFEHARPAVLMKNDCLHETSVAESRKPNGTIEHEECPESDAH